MNIDLLNESLKYDSVCRSISQTLKLDKIVVIKLLNFMF
jgi:hypothetical protein